MNHSSNIFFPRRGLTLIDLIVVIAIMAILGVVALPHYSAALVTYRVAAAGKRIAADLALAQNIAKTTSAGQSITFNLAGNNYQFSTYTGPLAESTQTQYTVRLASDPYEATIASANFNSTTLLTYDRFGQPSSGGTVVVQVGTAQKTITVDANSGKATVQ